MEFKEVHGFLVNKSGQVYLKSEVIEAGNQSCRFKRELPLREIKGSIDSKGYRQMSRVQDGATITVFAHRLVAMAYIPNPENKPQVNHIDGNPLNNKVENLEWCTNSENQLHSYNILGRERMNGSKNPKCIFSESDVLEIYRLAHEGSTSQAKIAELFDTKQITVSNIKTGKTWSWLTGHKDVH